MSDRSPNQNHRQSSRASQPRPLNPSRGLEEPALAQPPDDEDEHVSGRCDPGGQGRCTEADDLPLRVPRLQQSHRGRRMVRKDDDGPSSPLTAAQRLLLLDTWRRSGLPAGPVPCLQV